MEHDKELQLEILDKITQTGRVFGEDFFKMFDDWLEYKVVFKGLINMTIDGCAISEMNLTGIGRDGYYYQLNERGELLRKILRKEKGEETINRINIEREASEGTSRTNWTKVIGWGTILLIFLTTYLIYLEYNSPKTKDNIKSELNRRDDSITSFEKNRQVVTRDTVVVMSPDGKEIIYPKDSPRVCKMNCVNK
jgi:hypothetical protein